MRILIYPLLILLTAFSDLNGQIRPELVYPLSHSLAINNFSFSYDSKYIVSSSIDGTAKIWDCSSAKLLRTLHGHNSHVNFSEFSPDNKFIITASDDSVALIWETSTGKLIRKIKETGQIILAKFSNSGKMLATSTSNKSVKIWNLNDGMILHSLKDFDSEVYSIFFSKNDQWISTQLSKYIQFWNTQSGLEVAKFDKQIPKEDYRYGMPHYDRGSDPFGLDDIIVVSSKDSLVRLFDLNLKRVVKRLGKKGSLLASFSSKKNKILALYTTGVQIIDISTGQVNEELIDYYYPMRLVSFVPNSEYVLYTGSSEVSNNSRHFILIPDVYGKISPSQEWIVTIDEVNPKILNISPFQFGFVKKKVTPMGVNVNFDATINKSSKINSNGTLEAYTGSTYPQKVYIRNLKTGEIANEFSGHQDWIGFIDFSPNGKWLITGELFNEVIKFWSIETGQLEYTFDNGDRSSGIIYIEFDENHKFCTVKHRTGKITFWNIEKCQLLATKYIIDFNEWIAIHSSGLFDASEGALEKLYFVQGLESIEFSQLKERYYEPGLWKKVMNGEKLRDISMFNSIELPPGIWREEKTAAAIAKLVFTNHEGGIGQITVSVNGMESIEDLRPTGFNPKQPLWTHELNLSTLPNLKKGEENLIEVRAWNENHWVISRPLQIRYTPPGTKGAGASVTDPKTYKPNPSIYILSCGVSDYTNEGIDLKYAAKDAEAMANALQLGAKKLFGIDKAYMYTLTDNSANKPSKVNIQKTFQEISKKSSPNDVFVVYLSGHGINYGGENGDFYYLTNEAYSTDLQAYNDPAQRANAAISSKELIELFKTVPSDKRVLMIDACASGKMVENLVSSRDISSSTLRALDRLRDRTGFHIITGCAADAVSYEASRFGQGVLTYSLIEGIKGASLKENKFVDVNQLFQYAKERVPVLAKGIGGIQSPQVFSPAGSQSFDIGELDDATKKLIPLPKTRPVFVRSNFIDEQKLRDVVGITIKVNEALNEVSSKGESANLLFVDVEEYPEGCQLSGLYKQTENKITLRLSKMCNGKESTAVLEGKNAEELTEKIIAWMQ